MATATATKNYVSYCDALKGIVAGTNARVFFKNDEVNAANQGWCDGLITSATLTASGGYAVVFEYDTVNVPTGFVVTFDSATLEGNSCDPESLAECSLMKKIDAMQAAQEIAVNPPVQWGEIEGALSSQADLATVFNNKAGLLSPIFTGIPTAPTAATGTNTTQLSTTEFTNASIAAHTAAEDCHSWNKNVGITLNAGANIILHPVIDESGPVVTANALSGRAKFTWVSGNPLDGVQSAIQIFNSLCTPNSIGVASFAQNPSASVPFGIAVQTGNGVLSITVCGGYLPSPVSVNWMITN